MSAEKSPVVTCTGPRACLDAVLVRGLKGGREEKRGLAAGSLSGSRKESAEYRSKHLQHLCGQYTVHAVLQALERIA